MNRIRYGDVFKNKHSFLPVIHAENLSQVRRNVETALNAGADGVWLINHQIPGSSLLNYYATIRREIPNFWIGINLLDYGPIYAFLASPKGLQGLWIDYSGIGDEVSSMTRQMGQACLEIRFAGLYFGSVAFKGQPQPIDLAKAARNATEYMDILVTSGENTGIAAPVEKLRTIRESIGAFPVALASGVTPENVGEYLPYVDCFMVATGISTSFTELNPGKTRALAQLLKTTVA